VNSTFKEENIMIINHNSMASNALRQLNVNSNAQAKSMAKLSSGLRINTAADDAAGLAISEKMKGQIRGLNQASRNAQDGQSLVQTAEGALSQTTDILQRMRELATQASNDTNTSDDRAAMQQEVGQLSSEIDRISGTTQFNTKNLLDGSVGNTGVVSADGLKLGSVQVTNANLASDTYKVTAGTTAPPSLAATVTQNTTGLVAGDIDLTDNTKIKGLGLGNYTLNVKTGAASGTFDVSLTDKNGSTVASTNGWDGASAVTLQGSENGVATKFSLGIPAGTVQAGSMNLNLNATYTNAGDLDITNKAGGNIYSSAAGLVINDSNFQAGGFQFNMTVDSVLAGAKNSTITTTNNSLTMQIGANQGQTMNVSISKMDTTSLGVNNVDLTTQSGAEAAITAVDKAIQSVSTERAKLGAYSNRLDNTISNLNTSSQNTSDAQSRIADVDMASEMMNQSKSSVLAQAAQAMLAQANQQPQQVLQLLRG
jgi:flagellin